MDEKKETNKLIVSPPLDYFIIGHITADLTSTGIQLGGTVSFSGLTAQALGLRTGIMTSFSKDLDTKPLRDLWTVNKPSQQTTTYKNLSNGVSRVQYLYQTAEPISKEDVPELDPSPSIIHLGPLVNDLDPNILDCFPQSLKCLTPQGWMRTTDSENRVHHQVWKDYETVLKRADIAVISLDDVAMDEDLIASMANIIPIFVVTENVKGARVYWHNDARFFNAPEVKFLDDTGAGDIFATAFFSRYYFTKDPWEAGRFAVLLASWSVTRKNLDSIPTPEEINRARMQLLDT